MATTTISEKKPAVNFSRPRHILDKLMPFESGNNSNFHTNTSASSSDTLSDGSSSTEPARQISTPKAPTTDNDDNHVDEASFPTEPSFSTDSLPLPPHYQIPRKNSAVSTSDPTPPSTSSSNNPAKPRLRSILKSTTLEQHSERAPSSAFGEDIESHHTISENGSGSGIGNSQGYILEGRWSSSDADTSQLSEKTFARDLGNAEVGEERHQSGVVLRDEECEKGQKKSRSGEADGECFCVNGSLLGFELALLWLGL